MSGLLRRIRRPGAAEETRTEQTTLPDPAHGPAPAAPATGADGERLPAGVAPEDAQRTAATGNRRRLRKRARFLRRARELALRDLGGVVYEARRRQQDGGKVVEEKLNRLGELDAELHGIEDALGAPRGATVIREPGIGGTCARCNELHGSEARFCAHCGANLAEARRERAQAERQRADAERKAAAEKSAAEQEGHSGNGVARTKATAGGSAKGDAPATAGRSAKGDAPATAGGSAKGDATAAKADGAAATGDATAAKAGDDTEQPTTEQPQADERVAAQDRRA